MSSKTRLFFSKELKAGLISTLSKSQSHYIKNVMRIKPSEIISLFNSVNGEWDASILTHGKGLTEFKVEKLSKPQKKENIEKVEWMRKSVIKEILLNSYKTLNHVMDKCYKK